jgi:hypothetical protein
MTTGRDHNVSGILDYFYNGFCQHNGDYSPASLASKPKLVKRILRGEVYTLGRHYIATSAMIEMTRLWLLSAFQPVAPVASTAV